MASESELRRSLVEIGSQMNAAAWPILFRENKKLARQL
jgi:hypothetical protein